MFVTVDFPKKDWERYMKPEDATMNVIVQKDFELEEVLKKPLMAHLSSVANGEPRDSPVWFLYEDNSVWLFGTQKDSFIERLKKEPSCALGVVNFELEQGVLMHVGIRGYAKLTTVDKSRLKRFLAKYLGADQAEWNAWFVNKVVEPLDTMVEIVSKSSVAKNVSYFKSGPERFD